MKESRFIRLLETFDKKELDGFGHFLECFHSKKERAIVLYFYLQELYPRFPESKLKVDYISKTAYQNKADAKKIQNTMSDLYGWAKDYLIWQHHFKNSNKKDLLWLDILNARHMDHEYKLKADLMAKKFQGEKIMDSDDYLDRLKFYHNLWIHPTTQRHTTDFKVLNQCISNLELYHHVLKLNYDTEMENRQKMYKAAGGPKNIKITKSQPPENLLQKVSRLQYELVIFEKEGTFKELKKCYLYARNNLSPTYKSILLQYLINYSAAQIRQGKQAEYLPEAFKLYKRGLEEGSLVSHGIISAHNFMNIFSTAMGLGKVAWTKKFMDEYAPIIDPASQRRIELLVRAQYAFKVGNHHSPYFDELQSVTFSDPHTAIRTKILIMTNLYEKQADRETIVPFNTAFQYYLKRTNKIKGKIWESGYNFAICYRKLVLNRIGRSEFEKEVKSSPSLFLRDWLLSKSKDLDGSG